MAKINTKPKLKSTVNYEGGEAFDLPAEEKLLHVTATCLFKEPKFYGNAEEQNNLGDTEKTIFELCKTVDPKFMLQLASYLRNEQYLRTIPIVLLACASTRPEAKGTGLVPTYAPYIIRRADEINEVLAAYQTIFTPARAKGNNVALRLPNSLKKANTKSFPRFDAYQFAKYNRKGIVTFKDAIMLTHPSQPSTIIKKILDCNLETPYTWETELSKSKDKTKTWEQLIDSNKLPYMALIRNLRNILDANVSQQHLDKVIITIKRPDLIAKSKLFPFRFYQAYQQLVSNSNPSTTYILDSLAIAMDYAFAHVPHLDGTTFIACDTSGSMDSLVSQHGTMSLKEIGILFGLAAHKFTDKSLFGCFGDNFGICNLTRSASIIDRIESVKEWSSQLGWSTNGFLAIKYLNERNIFVDRILVFTDCQLYDSHTWWCKRDERTIRQEYNAYKTINPNCKLYLFDLSSYGTVNFPASDRSVVNVSGWSEKIFNFIKLHEADPKAQIKYIKEHYDGKPTSTHSETDD